MGQGLILNRGGSGSGKEITTPPLYVQHKHDYEAGWALVNSSVPIKPLSITCDLTQRNGNASNINWNIQLQGLDVDSNQWVDLCSKSVTVGGSKNVTISDTFLISTNSYCKEYRVWFVDHVRTTGDFNTDGNHIIISGVIK